MPVSREQLAQYVAELGLPKEQSDSMIETLMANDKSATQFVGQRLRHDDYTRKTQEAAEQRRQIESQAASQVTAYAQELTQAQNKISEIMNDLEKEQISAATANARLAKVKTKFNLSDDDIPALEGVANPAGTGNPEPKRGEPGINIEKRLEEFGKQIIKTVRDDLLAMPNVTAVQIDIPLEHQELTGKRLTRKEHNELLTMAREKRMTFEQAWEEKYNINDLRREKEVEARVQSRLKDEEAKRKQANSEAALAGVRTVDPTRDQLASPVLRKQFQTQSQDGPGHAAQPTSPAQATQQGQAPQQPQPRLSGAERAAAKFLERRNAGIPLGAPASN